MSGIKLLYHRKKYCSARRKVLITKRHQCHLMAAKLRHGSPCLLTSVQLRVIACIFHVTCVIFYNVACWIWLHAKDARTLRGMSTTFHVNSVIVYNNAHLEWSHAQGYPKVRVLYSTHCQNYRMVLLKSPTVLLKAEVSLWNLYLHSSRAFSNSVMLSFWWHNFASSATISWVFAYNSFSLVVFISRVDICSLKHGSRGGDRPHGVWWGGAPRVDVWWTLVIISNHVMKTYWSGF